MTSNSDKSKKERVSIVVPCYNRKHLLDECLSSVFRQDYSNKEVIVIDDNSEENISGLIKTKYPKVKIITNNINKGPSFAKNQGIIASTGNYVLFLDNDSELIERNTVSKMVAMLNKNKNIGCLGGEIVLNKAGKKSKVIGQNLKEGYITATKENKRKKCDFLSTANCIVRKEVIKKTNGFDPYYFYPMEDTDFGISIKRLGYDNITNFDIGALHKYSKSARLNRVYTLYKTKTRFLIKNYSIKKAIMSIPKDIEESIIVPIQNLLYRNLTSKKENRTTKEETIGPIEQNTLHKIMGFISIPFFLSGAYIWNIIHLEQTLNSKNKNFLEEKNMKEYERSLKP